MEKINIKKAIPQIVSNNVFQIALMIIVVVGAFFMGSLWTKVRILEKGTPAAVQPAAQGTAQQQAAKPTIALAQVQDAYNKSLIKFGDSKKKVMFVEISDPSCPYCHIAGGKNSELNSQTAQFKLVADGGTYVAPVPEMKKLIDSGKAAYTLLYYPGHGNGEMGAKAFYCAFEKGKFWQVNDLLMTNAGYNLLNNTIKNDKTKSGELAQFLAGAIDSNFMKTCLESGKYDNQLSKDQELARGLNVAGTPGFFVNTTVFSGAYSFTDMQPAVNTALGQ
jgi:protein-disulfide isomerase